MTAPDPIWAMGLMCGTSMDGVDAAMLLTDGEGIAAFGPSLEVTPAYNNTRHALLERVMADEAAKGAGAEERADAARAVTDIHFAAVTALRARLQEDAALLGFHGQTVFHDPAAGRTVQIGEAERLADLAGLPVIADFRSADMAAGGEGAPLAPFFHFALARHIGATEPVAFLNIGGVANVTWVDPGKDAPEDDGALVAFDTGPGNALVNDWMAQHRGEPLDRDGAAAAQGRVAEDRLRQNATDAYTARTPPKSLDRNTFALAGERMAGLSVEDGAATLTALTARTIAASVAHMPEPPARWLVCGGGRQNPVMMAMLGSALDAPVDPVEAVGLDGDMLEAQAFAYLAVRSLRGLPLSAPGTTGCASPVTGGVLSDPRRPRPGPSSGPSRTR